MDCDLPKLKSGYLYQWTNENPLDERLTHFDAKFEEWFAQIPPDCQPIVLTLLENFKYYTKKTVNEWLVHLHKQLIANPGVSEENTVFAFIKSPDGISNSSNDYWTEYKLLNKINNQLCYEELGAISVEQWPYINNIIFIDDFSGSGGSFLQELNKHKDTFAHKRVFFIAITVMEIGLDKIKSFGKENDIEIITLVVDTQKKAFESNYFEDDEAAKLRIGEMSTKFNIPSNEKYGYKKSQSLIAFYNNTPNNTLGFFRYDTDIYTSIFPRRNEKKPAWQLLKTSSESRKATNYNNTIRKADIK